MRKRADHFALSRLDLATQVQRMVAFIEHEAREREEEIDSKADGEYEYERGRLMQRARQEAQRAYEKRESAVLKQAQINEATYQIKSRLRELACREAHVVGLEAEVQKRLLRRMEDRRFYEDLLLKLLVQALVRLLERNVIVQVREQDVDLVRELLEPAQRRFEELVKRRVRLTLDTDEFLPSGCLGGVELVNPRRTVRVTNTVLSRLQMIVRQLVPSIREILLDKKS